MRLSTRLATLHTLLAVRLTWVLSRDQASSIRRLVHHASCWPEVDASTTVQFSRLVRLTQRRRAFAGSRKVPRDGVKLSLEPYGQGSGTRTSTANKTRLPSDRSSKTLVYIKFFNSKVLSASQHSSIHQPLFNLCCEMRLNVPFPGT